MFDLEEEDMYFPNTEVMRELLKSLNYSLKPINSRVGKDPVACRSICFSEWVTQFDALKESNTMYFCADDPNLTEDQARFVISILHVCPDYETFKEALEQYVNHPQPSE